MYRVSYKDDGKKKQEIINKYDFLENYFLFVETRIKTQPKTATRQDDQVGYDFVYSVSVYPRANEIKIEIFYGIKETEKTCEIFKISVENIP